MGLSPRVRGNLGGRCAGLLAWGSIPARAGEPSAIAASRIAFAVYPRACGGTTSYRVIAEPPLGLSPRVRGNHAVARRRIASDGSIPARAGEPTTPTLSDPTQPVYPRACGGTVGMVVGPGGEVGLSPRVRGNPVERQRLQVIGRSIPARAGEPPTPRRCRLLVTVYPLACGGTLPVGSLGRLSSGLSPRVRGNHAFGLRG